MATPSLVARTLARLYESPLDGVVRTTIAQIKLGAPAALVPISLLPVRVLGALQQLAPDWVTALGVSSRLPGNPMAAGAAAAAQSARSMRARTKKEE